MMVFYGLLSLATTLRAAADAALKISPGNFLWLNAQLVQYIVL
ncbi:hypothetical protein CJA_2028 [Cellvibrio japonicus Ueda107]|uniref:Uncharacterized protein n=1 Tax=Cellvibrio japonicus (strain Ueda107) TaxID=498211 RepID=B3PHM7_CELJU|nr:hypothetical protein CJA_2028 [Cellvibrio japonicus Ueda107]